MKVAIDAVCAENRSGTGRYTSELLRAIHASDTDMRFAVRLNGNSPLVDELAGDKRFEISAVGRQQTFWRIMGQNRTLNRWVEACGPDVLHGPAFVVPSGCKVPTVVTVHDLVFRLFPDTIPWLRRLYYERVFSRSIRAGDLLLCDSENTRRDLMHLYAVNADQARTVHLGVDARFFDKPPRTAMDSVREKYNLPENFLLTLGTLEPRKNLPRVIAAYAQSRERSETLPPLVIAGRTGWGTQEIQGLLENPVLKGHIILPGFIDDEDLPSLYRLCDVFLHVSLYEGFGLPLLEAMASEAMVLAGDNSSQPEILSDKRFLVDASDVKCIGDALLNCLELKAQAESIGKHNRLLADRFSWQKTAAETLAAYRIALDEKRVSRP